MSSKKHLITPEGVISFPDGTRLKLELRKRLDQPTKVDLFERSEELYKRVEVDAPPVAGFPGYSTELVLWRMKFHWEAYDEHTLIAEKQSMRDFFTHEEPS